MSQKKSSKPEFYTSFMKKDYFPNANKIIKYQESENYWIFKTGKKIFKVKKKEDIGSAVPLEEIFCNEIVNQIQQFSPNLEAEIRTIKKLNDTFVIDWENNISSSPLYFAVSMNQLPDKGFLDNIISKGKLSNKSLDQISAFVCQIHANSKVDKSKQESTPEKLNAILENLYYQSKKYLGETINKAIIDMTFRPLEKYLVENRKLFNRRVKNGYIRRIHGCLVPRKIHLSKETINLLGRTSDPLKDHYKDVASDIADFIIELQCEGLHEPAQYFINNYCKLTEDKELKQVLPIYSAMRCLYLGLKYSVNIKQLDKKSAETEKMRATKYYEHTIEVVRGL